MKISETYGNSNNEVLKSISSSGKSIFIDFKKLDNERSLSTITTFTALIKYKKMNSDCESWLDVNENILMSRNHSKIANCSWLITSMFGSYIILNFQSIVVN